MELDPRFIGAPLSAALPASARNLQAGGGADEKMRAAAAEFESMVLGQLLQPMFAALDTRGLGGGGAGEAMFRPMLVERYAEAISRNGGLGIADAVMRTMIEMQGGNEPQGGYDAIDR